MFREGIVAHFKRGQLRDSYFFFSKVPNDTDESEGEQLDELLEQVQGHKNNKSLRRRPKPSREFVRSWPLQRYNSNRTV